MKKFYVTLMLAVFTMSFFVSCEKPNDDLPIESSDKDEEPDREASDKDEEPDNG